MYDIFIAGDKNWHHDFFLRQKPNDNNNWVFISTSTQLEEMITTQNPRYIFFLHWSKIIPKSIWSKFECVGFHMTDLPFGRGGSPLQNLILKGFEVTKLSAFRIEEELDAGPIYVKKSLSLSGNAKDIYYRSTELSWEIIKWIVKKEPNPIKQIGEVVNFKRRNSKESEIPNLTTTKLLFDFIRMLDAPDYPKAFMKNGEFILEFSDAQFINNKINAKVTIHHKDYHETK